MSITRIGAVERETESELMPLDEVATRLRISLPTLRRWIKADLADGRNRVPGARGVGSSYRVVRSIFDRAMRDGVEPERTSQVVMPDLDEIVAHLRRRAADDVALATRIETMTAESRQMIASRTMKKAS